MQPGRLFRLVKNYDAYVARIAFAVLAANFVLALVLGLLFGSFVSALLIGLLLVSGPVVVQKLSSQSALAAGVMAFSYMSFVTLHVHLTYGLIEMHFGYFALLAILYAYQRVSTILVAAASAAVYHIGFSVLQSGGAAVYLYPENSQLVAAAGIPVFILVHAAYVLVEAAVLILMAMLSRPITETAQTIIQSNERMLNPDGSIDLTQTIDDNGNELVQRYAQLLSSVRDVVSRAAETSRHLQASLGTMSETYREVSSLVQHQKTQTEQMTQSLQNVAQGFSSLSEFSALLNTTSQQLDDNKAASLAATADSVSSSEESGALVALTSQSLSRVDKDTESISGMVASIQGIAEQTNLLALNAAIEAARAGEQGRGFAVVADEVRQLATRAHEATTDINGIVRQLADGAAEAVTTMQRTVTEIEQTRRHGALASEKMTQLGAQIDDVRGSNRQMTSEIEQQIRENETLSEQLGAVAKDSERMFTMIDKGLSELTDVEQAFRELNDSLQTFRS